MNDSLEALKNVYFTMRRLINEQPDSATQSEKDQLYNLYLVAQRNYFRAVQGAIQGDDALVASLTKQLKDAQDQIDGMVVNEQNFAGSLQVIAGVVHLASSVAGFFV